MRNSVIDFETDGSLGFRIQEFKKKFPDAIWSISEPVMEKWRKGEKARVKQDGTVVPEQRPAPFSIFLCNDDRIGEAGHFFAIIETESVFDGMVKAIRQVEDQHATWVAARKK